MNQQIDGIEIMGQTLKDVLAMRKNYAAVKQIRFGAPELSFLHICLVKLFKPLTDIFLAMWWRKAYRLYGIREETFHGF